VSNYIQPDYRNPTPNPQVGVQPHQAGAASGNPLNLNAPVAVYVQPDTAARALQPGQLNGTWLGTSKNGPFEKT
jgi:hypothetical protein